MLSSIHNKKEVIIEIIRQIYAKASEQEVVNYSAVIRGNRADDYKEGRKMVRFLVRQLYAAHSGNPEIHKQIMALILLDKEIETINREEEQKIVSFIASLLRRYKAFVRVRDFEAAAILLNRAADEIIHRIRIIGTDIDEKRMLRELEDMICRYLLVEK